MLEILIIKIALSCILAFISFK